MVKSAAKQVSFFFVFFYFLMSVHAEIPESVEGLAEYTLQNGMEVFILEDSSSAPVRIEYTVHAGISSQTPETVGFFPLYTRLFSSAGEKTYGNKTDAWLPSRTDASCGADSARYILTVSPAQTETALAQIAQCAFAPVFGDTELQAQFSALKTEVMNYAFSTAGFINSSIDARVFADAPWKQDTGVYPALFAGTPLAKVRTILSDISHAYYIPQNSALFISGGIEKKTALQLAERTFGSWPAGIISPQADGKKTEAPVQQAERHRRFVIYDPLFSSDIAQIVVQYTDLSMTQSDAAAAVFGANDSSFKKMLLSDNDLAIRGKEYINTAAAHKNGQSRLIFQSLLEKSKIPPDKQAARFLDCVKKAADSMENTEFQQASAKLSADYRSLYANSAAVMDKLSELWAIENNGRNSADAASLISRLCARPDEIGNLTPGSLRTAFDSGEPFVFVLINSSIYKKNADSFKDAGYEPVTQKNGSWYTQELYKNVTDSGILVAQDEESETPGDASYYISRNDPQFSLGTLSNGIPVVFKQNTSSETALLMISISGGKISSAASPGFFTILINALAGNIQKEINKQTKNGTINEIPPVLAETDLTSGMITIECQADDMNSIIPCISRALIYGDIQPAQADGLIYDARSHKQLYDGDTANQLYSSAVLKLFSGSPYTALFSSGSTVLEQTQYNDILVSYPSLLDASRYTVIVTGRFDTDDIHTLLESSLGILEPRTKRENARPSVPSPQFPSGEKMTVRLQHLFLADVNAENAGPQPSVLVPTKNFSDPVQYWIPAPVRSSPDFPLFNALVYTLAFRLKKNAAAVSPDITVQADAASYGIQAAVITLTHIDHTKQADTLYEKTTEQLCGNAEDKSAWKNFAGEMLSRWILGTLGGTQTNRGTALLIHEGIESGQSGNILRDAKQYLYDYETVSAAAQDRTAALCSRYFSGQAPLSLYSKDAQK